jgi:hypothetical protein
MIKAAGNSFQYHMLKCEEFGIPQTRHRVFMVGFRDGYPEKFEYPKPQAKCVLLSDFLGLPIVKPMSNTVRCSGRKSGVDNAKNWSAYRLKDGTVFEYTLEHVTKLQGFPLDFEWGGAPDSQRWKMLGNTIPTCLSRAILDAVGKHLANFPEHPAAPLPQVPHPPPVRTIIEQHLVQCEKAATERQKQRASKADDDAECDDEDEDDECVYHGVSAQDFDGACQSDADADEAPRAKRPLAASAPTSVKRQRLDREMLRIVIKTGTTISLTLPEGQDEQQYFLKVIK